jgi:hypothetical protein
MRMELTARLLQYRNNILKQQAPAPGFPAAWGSVPAALQYRVRRRQCWEIRQTGPQKMMARETGVQASHGAAQRLRACVASQFGVGRLRWSVHWRPSSPRRGPAKRGAESPATTAPWTPCDLRNQPVTAEPTSTSSRVMRVGRLREGESVRDPDQCCRLQLSVLQGASCIVKGANIVIRLPICLPRLFT